MTRELLLVALLCALCGPALMIAGSLPLRLRDAACPRQLERRAWRRIWLPLGPAGLIAVFLIGWAIQEPAEAEPAAPALLALAAVFGVIFVRAGIRAARALLRPAPDAVAMTTGLLRPRVFIAPELAVRLDERALRAAVEHEAAHVRHRDPLRLWLAQLATDLQWPSPAARRRFADWRTALELARDAEACDHVEGSDLAAALIEAARLTRATRVPAPIGLVAEAPGAVAFTHRIHRLLDAERDPAAAPARRSSRWTLLATAGLAVLAGVAYGESLIRLVPGLG
jgi:hypothetical protein